MKIESITHEMAEEIIDTRKPLGYFIVDNEDGTFTAIDNSYGDAWTEDFCNEERAKEWLAEYCV